MHYVNPNNRILLEVCAGTAHLALSLSRSALVVQVNATLFSTFERHYHKKLGDAKIWNAGVHM